MLILGLILPSKLRGLHYWPQCIYTKIPPLLPVYLNFPEYVMHRWQSGRSGVYCRTAGGDNLRLFMNKQKFAFRLSSVCLWQHPSLWRVNKQPLQARCATYSPGHLHPLPCHLRTPFVACGMKGGFHLFCENNCKLRRHLFKELKLLVHERSTV